MTEDWTCIDTYIGKSGSGQVQGWFWEIENKNQIKICSKGKMDKEQFGIGNEITIMNYQK